MAGLFVSDLKPWVKEIFLNREKLVESSMFKTPWVILTSPALVVQQSDNKKLTLKEREAAFNEIIKNPNPTNGYQGCIITNEIQTPGNAYSATGPSYIGVDFSGKRIPVFGENGRTIPNLIIESLEIDTDGVGNALKVATINVRLFSLKQLEMFELFYLKPGMNILLEFGNNQSLYANIRKEYIETRYGKNPSYQQTIGAQTDISLANIIIDKSKYDNFCSNFADLSIGDIESLRKYYQRVEDSRGTYEQIAGKVLEYSYSIQENGTYIVTFKISGGNEVSRAIPKSTTSSNSKSKGPSATPMSFNTWINQIESDFSLPDLSTIVTEKDDKKHFYNWGITNDNKAYESLSKKPYITLGFVIDKILNHISKTKPSIVNSKFIEISKQEFYTDDKGGGKTQIILANSSDNLISANENIIFPGQLPKIIKNKKNNTIVLSTTDKGNIEKTNCSINGLEFSLTESALYIENEKYNETNKNIPTPKFIKIYDKSDNVILGNALNIFLSYEKVKEIWQRAYTNIDFLESILAMVNDNSFGMMKLVIGSLEGGKSASFIVDGKIKQGSNILAQAIKTDKNGPYRFKPTTIQSIVKEFTYEFNMSDSVAGRTLFNAYAHIAQVKSAQSGSVDDSLLGIPKNAYEGVDFYTTQNADGFYSLNYVDVKAIEKTMKKAAQDAAKGLQKGTNSQAPQDVSLTISANSKKFKIGNTEKVLIFTDEKFIGNIVSKSFYEKNKSLLTPIEISLVIDGISGISCGEFFLCDGVPEIHNIIGAFQIENVKHAIGPDGWYTTIDARWRVLDIK
jgi:hypothetical protein